MVGACPHLLPRVERACSPALPHSLAKPNFWRHHFRDWCRFPETDLALGPERPSATEDRAGWRANAPDLLRHSLAHHSQ